jgi:hypothetical protein
MSFKILGDTGALTRAIDTFKAQYHDDYFKVRSEGKAYLAAPVSLASARRLVGPLLAALNSWGAGKRGAPACTTVDAAAQGLSAQGLHGMLQDLANSVDDLDVVGGRRVLGEGAPFANVAEFDRALIDTLNMLADALLPGNTNVTYPMKALLLITGLAPAYDKSRIASHIRGLGSTPPSNAAAIRC